LKSVKGLQGYGNLLIFKMAGIRHIRLNLDHSQRIFDILFALQNSVGIGAVVFEISKF